MLNKVLIIRYSSMGDVLLITPVIRLLHHKFAASIYVLTKERYVDVLQFNPYVTGIYTKEKTSFSTLKKVSFDYVIDLQKNLSSIFLTTILRIPSRAFKKLTLSKWLFLAFRTKRFVHSHVVLRYIETVSHFGIEDDGQGLEFYYESSSSIESMERGKKTIVISLGGTYLTKRIPFNLVRQITRDRNYNFILIGGKDVADYDALLKPNVQNLIGETTLNESANIISQSDLVISGDTGLMHMAAAFQKPLIVIWGSTSPDFGFTPFYGFKNRNRSISIQNEDLSCRPCSKYGRSKCPKGHMNCLNWIEEREISLAISKILR